MIRSIALNFSIHINIELGVARGQIIQLLRMSVYLSNTGMPNYSLRPFSIWYVRCGCMLRYVLLTSSARSLNHPSLLRSSILKLGDGGFIFSVSLKFLLGEACFHLHSFRLDASCARLISAFGGFLSKSAKKARRIAASCMLSVA